MGAPELQNISRIAGSIKTQDFLTKISFKISSIYVGVSGRVLVLSFVMSHTSVNSDIQIPVHVLMINQRHLFVHRPYGIVSHIQDYVQYKMFCNSGVSTWLSVGLILASLTLPSLLHHRIPEIQC